MGKVMRGRGKLPPPPGESDAMIDKELLEILACPENKEQVRLGDAALLGALNTKAERGQLVNRGGEKVSEPMDAILVRADGKVGYPVRDGIPIMLIEEGLLL